VETTTAQFVTPPGKELERSKVLAKGRWNMEEAVVF
jgi:hypothetical protein